MRPPFLLFRLTFVSLSLCALSGELHAAWQPNGVPVAPAALNVIQTIPTMCTDGSGGAFVGWREASLADRGNAFLQRIDSEGNIPVGWSALGLRIGSNPGSEFICNLASDMAGGAYVVWWTRLADTLEYRLVRIVSSGVSAPGWPQAGLHLPVESGSERMDDLCADGNGGLFIAWTSSQGDVFVLHYTGSGALAPGWPVTGQRIVEEASIKSGAQLIPTAQGGFLASWTDLRGGSGLGYVRYALKVTPDGQPDPAWPIGGVKVNALPTAIENAYMVSDGAGGTFIGWDDNRTGVYPPIPLDYDIYAQHILSNGTVDAAWPADGLAICTAASAQYFFEMAPDGSGGVIVVWDDYRSGSSQIYSTRINSNGTVAPGWTPNGSPMAPFAAPQTIPDAVGDGSGGVYGIWEESRGIVGQHLNQIGSTVAGWAGGGNVVAGQATCNLPTAISDDKGGALVAYRRSTSTPTLTTRIYVLRIYGDFVVSTLPAFLDMEVGPGSVTLRWTIGDASHSQFRVYRRQDGTDWTGLGSTDQPSEAVTVYRDTGLIQGRYWYRLGISTDGGAEMFTEAVAVDVPSQFVVQLAGFRPNPANGIPSLAFTLSDDRAARVEVFDVKGRVIASRDVGSLGLGHHMVTLDGIQWRSGVYWMRLTHGDETMTKTGLVTR